MIENQVELGIVGTGFIASGLVNRLEQNDKYKVKKVLTRRPIDTVPLNEVTNDPEDLLDTDLVVLSVGDPVYGTMIADGILNEGIPVVTMDAELQVTSGTYLQRRGLFTEAQGDQPGSTAVLREEALSMGLTPVVYGNVKGFLNHEPSEKDMEYWGRKQGISLQQVTSFTDGTKVQIEQALIANAFGATILKQGLEGIRCETMRQGAEKLARRAKELGQPISDYIMPKLGNPGVFMVADANGQLTYFDYYKVTIPETSMVFLERPYHLCHLEVPMTIDRVMNGGGVLLNNGENPTIGVAGIAKRDIKPGEKIRRAIGSFDVRGEAVPLTQSHMPIGLIQEATVDRAIERGQIIQPEDVIVPDSLAFRIWQNQT